MAFIQRMCKSKVLSNPLAMMIFSLLALLVTAEKVHCSSSPSKINQNATAELNDTHIEHDSTTNSLFNEEFKSKMQHIEDELDKLKIFLRSNQDNIFFRRSSANTTIAKIESNIDETGQLMKKFRNEYLPEASHSSVIISLETIITDLQTSLRSMRIHTHPKLSPGNASNDVLEKTGNLIVLLDNFIKDLDDLEEKNREKNRKIEAEKTAKRLLDEAVDDIKRNDILNIQALQVDINNLQKSIRKEQQEEMTQMKKELLQTMEDFRHEFENSRGKTAQNDVKDVKRLVDDIRLIRAIKSGWFSEAEKTLKECDNSTYKYVIGEVYNNHAENFPLILRFAESIRDIESKFKVYDVLYHEMINNKHHDVWQLLQFLKSIQTNMLDRSPHATLARSLYETVRNKIESAVASNSTTNDRSVVNLSDADCFQCRVGKWQEVIKELWGNLTTDDIFARAPSTLIDVDDQIAFEVAVFRVMQQRNEIYSQNSITLARHMKMTTDDAKYQFASAEARSRRDEIKNKLPKSVKNIVFSKAICIRNVKVNEYLHSTWKTVAGLDILRYSMTWIPGGGDDSKATWKVIFVNDFQIQLLNAEYNRTLFAHNYDMVCPSCHSPNHGRGVFLWNVENHNCTRKNCYWNIAVQEDFIIFKNVEYNNEVLFASVDMKLDEERRRVFTYIDDQITDKESTKWDISDCSKE